MVTVDRARSSSTCVWTCNLVDGRLTAGEATLQELDRRPAVDPRRHSL